MLVVDAVSEVGVEGAVLESGVVDQDVLVQIDLSKPAGRSFVLIGVADRPSEAVGELARVAIDGGVHLRLLIGRAVAQADRAADSLAGACRWHLGDQVEHTADGIGAVEHRPSPPHHFHGLDVGDVDEAGDLTEIGLTAGVVHPQTVLEEEDPVAPVPADNRPHLMRSDSVDVDARLAAQEIRGVVRLQLFDPLRRNDDDRRSDLKGSPLGSGGSHRGRVEEHRLSRLLLRILSRLDLPFLSGACRVALRFDILVGFGSLGQREA